MASASVSVDHNVASLVSSNPNVKKTPAEKAAISAMRKNGPMHWDGILPTTIVVKLKTFGVSAVGYLHASVARVDANGDAIKGLYDTHNYVEDQALYFRTNKFCLMYLESYDKQMAEKAVERDTDESAKDYEARMPMEVRKVAVRHVLNEICKKHGCTLDGLEAKKAIYQVRCRS